MLDTHCCRQPQPIDSQSSRHAVQERSWLRPLLLSVSSFRQALVGDAWENVGERDGCMDGWMDGWMDDDDMFLSYKTNDVTTSLT